MGRSPGRIPLIPQHENPVSSQTAAVFVGSCEANILINLQHISKVEKLRVINYIWTCINCSCFFLVDEFVLSKAPWAVEFLPQTLQKTAPEQWVWISFGQLAVRFQSYATQRDCGVPVARVDIASTLHHSISPAALKRWLRLTSRWG